MVRPMLTVWCIVIDENRILLGESIIYIFYCSYSKGTGSTNLDTHLQHVHKTFLHSTQKDINQKSLMESFFASKKRKSTDSSEQSQYIFARQVVLCVCRDLLNFNFVEGAGFKLLWASKYVNSKYKLPCRATVELSGLDDVYNCCKTKLIEVLAKAPDHCTITFDCWTDNVKRLAYVTYSYHFMKNWEIKTAVLKTGAFPHPHTGQRLKEDFEETLTQFQLREKIITVVTDGGSNVKKASELLRIYRANCISHATHLLISCDLLKHDDMEELRELFSKLRQIQAKLVYKYNEMKEIDTSDKQQKVIAAIKEYAELGKFVSICF